MSEGVGYNHIREMLPKAQFSTRNPYWQRVKIPSVYPEYQPQKSARDFLYATTWELWADDVVGANFVRTAVRRTVRFNLRISLQKQVIALLDKPKEKKP